MVFTPSFYAKAPSAKVVIYIGFILVLIVIPSIYVFENIAALSQFVYTDTFLPASSVPYYAVLAPSIQSQTARYGLAWFILESDHLRPILFIIPILLVFIGIRKSAIYGIFLIFTVFFTGIEVIKLVYHGLSWLDCDNFWHCRGRDISAPLGSVSFEFWVVFGANIAIVIIGGIQLALVSGLKQFMKIIIFQELTYGHIAIATSLDSHLSLDSDKNIEKTINDMSTGEIIKASIISAGIEVKRLLDNALHLISFGAYPIEPLKFHQTPTAVVKQYIDQNKHRSTIEHTMHGNTCTVHFNSANICHKISDQQDKIKTKDYDYVDMSNDIDFI